MGGEGQILAWVVWVAWVHKILAWVVWVAWVHKFFGVGSVGRNFGAGGMVGVGQKSSMGKCITI